jgi:G3E family GTPase
MIRVVDGLVPADVILGVRSAGSSAGTTQAASHDDRYVSSSWTSAEPVTRLALDRFAGRLPPEVLRVKGRVLLDDGTWVLVQVVGRRIDITSCAPADRSELVAIAVRQPASTPPNPSPPNPFVLHFG